MSENISPAEALRTDEEIHYLMCFCSLITILHGKRLNLPNIFLLLLKNSNYRELFKRVVGVETDYEIFQLFIRYDPFLAKSKYISKYLNKTPKSKILQ